jgi:hypothetical protein
MRRKLRLWPAPKVIGGVLLLVLLFLNWLRLGRIEKELNRHSYAPLTVLLPTNTPTATHTFTPTPTTTSERTPEADSQEASMGNPSSTSEMEVADQGPAGRDWGLVTSGAGFGAHRGLVPLAFQDKLWVLGGEGSDSVWSSTDGGQWVEASPQFYISSLCDGAAAFKGRLWAVGGHYVVSSADGAHWDLVNGHPPFGSRNQITLTAFNNRLWMIGGVSEGTMNDVWCSENGKDWECALRQAPFPQRRAHGTAVFQGKIWVTGGIRDSVYAPLDDIWNSADGFHWQQVQAGPHYDGRHSTGFTAYHDKLWVIAGDNGKKRGGVSDAWMSPDGVHWSCVNRAGAFRGRVANSAVVFKDRIWIMGGDDAQVWCTPPLDKAYTLP